MNTDDLRPETTLRLLGIPKEAFEPWEDGEELAEADVRAVTAYTLRGHELPREEYLRVAELVGRCRTWRRAWHGVMVRELMTEVESLYEEGHGEKAIAKAKVACKLGRQHLPDQDPLLATVLKRFARLEALEANRLRRGPDAGGAVEAQQEVALRQATVVRVGEAGSQDRGKGGVAVTQGGSGEAESQPAVGASPDLAEEDQGLTEQWLTLLDTSCQKRQASRATTAGTPEAQGKLGGAPREHRPPQPEQDSVAGVPASVSLPTTRVTAEASVAAEPRQALPDWAALRERARAWKPLPLPSLEETVCLTVLAARERVANAQPLPVRDFLRDVKVLHPSWSKWSLARLRDVIADPAVQKGFLHHQVYVIDRSQQPAGGALRGSSGTLMGPGVESGEDAVTDTAYRLAHSPEELLACIANSIEASGTVTPEFKEQFLRLCRSLGVDESIQQQIRAWLETL